MRKKLLEEASLESTVYFQQLNVSNKKYNNFSLVLNFLTRKNCSAKRNKSDGSAEIGNAVASTSANLPGGRGEMRRSRRRRQMRSWQS